MKNLYVVCMDSSYVRDAQMLDTKDLPEKEFNSLDINGSRAENMWHDMEPNPFIAIIRAENNKEACEIAGKEKRYDSRVLYAIEVK